MAEDRLALLEQLVRDNPTDSRLRYMLAMELVSRDNVDQAVEEFQKLTSLDPDYVPAYFQCGQALAQAGRTGEAKDWYQRGIAAAERAGDIHARLEIEQALRALETDWRP